MTGRLARLSWGMVVGIACVCGGEEGRSVGNVDGCLHWFRSQLSPGETWTVSVALVSAENCGTLSAGREAAAGLVPGPAAAGSAVPMVVIANGSTDFALDGYGRFFWENGRRQMLADVHGGQLSRFLAGVSYRVAEERQDVFDALGSAAKPAFEVAEPIHAVSPRELCGVLATPDQRVRVAVRAALPEKGTVVRVDYTLAATAPVQDLRFSVYANLEAAHTHENDYAQLDRKVDGLVCYDPTTGACVGLLALSPPARGFAGIWPSETAFRQGLGEDRAGWQEFAVPEGKALQVVARGPLPHPVAPVPENPSEPPTVCRSTAGAWELIEQDWLAQVGGAIDLQTVLDEIQWGEELGARIVALGGEAPEVAELRKILNRVAWETVDEVAAERPVPDGLLARWSFERGTDERIPGVGSAAAEITVEGRWRRGAGAVGRAALLGGSTVLAVGPGQGQFAARPYTISAWLRSVSQEADVLGNGTGSGSVLLMSYKGMARAHHWTSGGLTMLDGTSRIDDGRWHHLAQVADNGSLKLYVDGKLEAEKALRGSLCASEAPLYVGWRGGEFMSSRYSGALDEVAIYGRALSGDDVAAEFALGQPGDQPQNEELRTAYLDVRRLKRQLLFHHPAVDFHEVLFIDQPYPEGSEWPHQARHRDGMMAVPGGRLLLLDGLRPDGAVWKMAPGDRPAAFWRFDLSFDAQRLLFCMKEWDDKAFHLYEKDLVSGRTRQLTQGDYDDTDPIYLPDGHLMFTTSRCNTYVRCMPYTYSYVLARSDGDGQNIYLISRNNEPDWLPSLLNDGRVIYSRWEYHDKALWRIQSLWTVNPDGTNVTAFWGNQSVWPDHLAEPRAIPGSDRVMFTGLAHHDWFAGSIGILDPKQGSNFPHGLTKVTAEVAWPECGTPPADPVECADYHSCAAYTAYKTPYPLSEDLFLVSARRGARGGKYVLLLMDTHGNRELIYEGEFNIWHALPLRARPAPPVLADRVTWPDLAKPDAPRQPGILYSNNVYYGVPELQRGEVKYVRVIQMDARTYSLWNRDSGFSGPRTSLVQTDGVRRILGTAPVGEDGSVCFEIPTGVALHFQVLDSEYRALQTMRSFTGAMPGETRGCLGCHEMHSKTPVSGRTMAEKRVPDPLTPPPWGTESLSYERMIQPLLDKHCGRCHQGDGKAKPTLDLTLRPGYGPFQEPYVTLVGLDGHQHQQIRQGPGARVACPLPVENFRLSDPASYVTFRPKTYLALRSPLREIAASGNHHGVQMTGDELRLLTAWLDANCPYRNDEDVRDLPDPEFTGIETLPVRPRTKTAPHILRP